MNRTLVKAFGVFCYYSGLIKFFYFLNRKKKRILTFHNVMQEKDLPYGKRIGLTHTETEFRKIVQEVGKHFSFGIGLDNTKEAIITFDDGYKNQGEIAARILNNLKIPAIIFVAGQNLNNHNPNKALVVDLLMHWVELAPAGQYELSDKRFDNQVFCLGADRIHTWTKIIWPAFTKDTKTKGESLLQILNRQYPLKNILELCSPEYLRLRLTGIDNDDIYHLQTLGWEIGWHTKSHYPLSCLPKDDMEQEMANAPEQFKKIIFSFPYGELASVNKSSVETAKQYFPAAVSNLPFKNNLTCNHFLPRFMLDSDKYLLHMELSGLKQFITHRKLL